MNKELKLTDDQILKVFANNRILAGKTLSVRNHARLLHAVKEIINIQIKLINEQV